MHKYGSRIESHVEYVQINYFTHLEMRFQSEIYLSQSSVNSLRQKQ